MVHLSINFDPELASDTCGLCGSETGPMGGPRLFLADREAVVCQACGKKHAPSLVALLDLARVAKRVGNLGRHTLVPPLGALLDLARAAEDYTYSISSKYRQAA